MKTEREYRALRHAKLESGEATPPHGSASTYLHYQCRCDPCKAANTERCRELQRRRAERLRADPTLAKHGKESTYVNWGCRCLKCKKRWSVVMKTTNARRKAAAK